MQHWEESLKSAIEQAGERHPPRKRARKEGAASASLCPGRDAGDTPASRAQQLEPEDLDMATSQSVQPDDDDDNATPQGHEIQVKVVPGAQCASKDRDGDRDASVRASINGISFLSQDALGEPRGNGFTKMPQRISMGNLVRAAISLHGANPAHPARPNSSLDAITMIPQGGATADFQLDRKATESFMPLFINEAAILYPHFDHAQLEKQYNFVVGDQDDTRRCVGERPSDADKFNAYMDVCIGTLLSSESTRLESYRKKLQNASLGLFDALLEDGDSLVPVACLILLTIYATYSPYGGSAWQLLGLAVKQCIFLGLHRGTPNSHRL